MTESVEEVVDQQHHGGMVGRALHKPPLPRSPPSWLLHVLIFIPRTAPPFSPPSRPLGVVLDSRKRPSVAVAHPFRRHRHCAPDAVLCVLAVSPLLGTRRRARGVRGPLTGGQGSTASPPAGAARGISLAVARRWVRAAPTIAGNPPSCGWFGGRAPAHRGWVGPKVRVIMENCTVSQIVLFTSIV